MNYKDYLKLKLKKFSKEDIIITNHAQEQAVFRGIALSEVMENIINPERLVFAGKEEAKSQSEEKFACYFAYSNTQCHCYVLVINQKCLVCTVIKINRRWQRKVEKYAKR
ncbi:hypothetical protein JW756_00875 [Candidatus Woesearchaeota archaeon]|nr:hypothetical protein [Candidatus Woesearchaeota archaeon]